MSTSDHSIFGPVSPLLDESFCLLTGMWNSGASVGALFVVEVVVAAAVGTGLDVVVTEGTLVLFTIGWFTLALSGVTFSNFVDSLKTRWRTEREKERMSLCT